PTGQRRRQCSPSPSFIFLTTTAIAFASTLAFFMSETARETSSESIASKKSSTLPMAANCSSTRVPSKSLASIIGSLLAHPRPENSYHVWQVGGSGIRSASAPERPTIDVRTAAGFPRVSAMMEIAYDKGGLALLARVSGKLQD